MEREGSHSTRREEEMWAAISISLQEMEGGQQFIPSTTPAPHSIQLLHLPSAIKFTLLDLFDSIHYIITVIKGLLLLGW